MPKHFVPGTSVRALCKTVFGDKIAKDVHENMWKTAEVQGVILLQPVGGKKVLVEWSDAPNNLQTVSAHGPQAFDGGAVAAHRNTSAPTTSIVAPREATLARMLRSAAASRSTKTTSAPRDQASSPKSPEPPKASRTRWPLKS
jgi:hypothetical protein